MRQPIIPPPAITVAADAGKLARAAASLLGEAISEAARRHGRAAIGLAGGTTPLAAYELLACERGLPWPQVHLFWSDERCVPLSDPRSNYGSTERALLNRLRARPAVHRIAGESGAEAAAAGYDAELRRHAGNGLDFLLLGIGEDGHIASLFPGSPALRETGLWACAASSQGRPARVTMTLPFINRCRQAAFLAAGARKSGVVNRLLSEAPSELPASQVAPREGIRWLLDREAAGGRRSYPPAIADPLTHR